MDDDVKVLERIYARFNARDIDGVLALLADDVVWANGMDGGHVHGREAVREYWTRQWTTWSVRMSSPWAFTQLRMAGSSQGFDSPSAISKANRSKGKRTD
jgi:ketosteroid isomerase-like protein